MTVWSSLRNKFKGSKKKDNGLWENHQIRKKFQGLSMKNLRVPLSWQDMDRIKPIRLALSSGIWHPKLANLSKVRLEKPYQWCCTSNSSTMFKLWISTNHYLKSNKSAKTSTSLQNFAHLLVSPNVWERTSVSWPRCAKVCSRNHMTESSRSVIWIRWLPRVKKLNSGVLKLNLLLILLRQMYLNAQKFMKLQISCNKQPTLVNNKKEVCVEIQVMSCQQDLLRTLTVSTRWFTSPKLLRILPFSVCNEMSKMPDTSMKNSMICQSRKDLIFSLNMPIFVSFKIGPHKTKMSYSRLSPKVFSSTTTVESSLTSRVVRSHDSSS